jgi:hypothetical protein
MPGCKKEIDAMVVTAVGFMAQANAEIRAARQQHQLQRAERYRRGRPIAFIDGLINDLETLNLKRVSRVPMSYESRLRQLRVLLSETAVPSRQLEKLRTRIGIVKLMDAVYAIQEGLFQNDREVERDVWSNALAGLD